ncbi:MAG: hypothetical protein H6815_06615 [Phycisphaeraceae bacterium]|nr:hypothetical protein [Phycisphaerales bacterium]MCB9860111.1 hypothetical protein [Phycisphaeraceae bacterium]
MTVTKRGSLRRAARMAAVAGLGLAAITLTACNSGPGKYTAEGKANALEHAAGLKSATEFDQARQAYFAGVLDQALEHINNSITLNDKVAKSWVLKGRIELDSQNFEGALESFAKATELDETDGEPMYFTGLTYERVGKIQQALDSYLQAFELDDRNAQYIVAVAETYIDNNQLEEAKTFLSDNSESFEFNPGIKQTLGHIAMIEGKPNEAYERFSEARILAPDDMSVLEDLTTSQVRTGKFAEAEYNLGKLLEFKGNTNRRDLQHLRARCLMEVDRAVEARELLIKLTQGTEGQADSKAWLQLGHVSYTLGDFNRVKQAAGRVIAQSPETADGYVLRALWQRSEGNLEAAFISLNKACEFRGEDTAPLMLKGLVAQQMGKYEIAKQSYSTVLSENPSDSAATQLLAAVEKQIESGSSVATVPTDTGN